MQIQLTTTQPLSSDTLIIPVRQTDELPDTLTALANRFNLTPAVLQHDFKADFKEVIPFYQPDGRKTYLLGLGKEPTRMVWLRAFRDLFFRQKDRLTPTVGVDLTGIAADVLESIVLGIRWGGYELKLHGTDRPKTADFYSEEGILEIYIADQQQGMAEEVLHRAEAIAATHRQILDLMNSPSNYKIPQVLADWAVASGQQYGYSVTVFDKTEIERQGLLALLSVNKGSEHPPVFIIAEYKPDHLPNAKKVGLVGKGVTFDTGGISIKPSTGMHLMKSDMGGAAAVLGTMEVAAKLRLPVHLIGIIPSTENMVDGAATKPGDVIGSYLGKTIEVIDTDAEGRIILADGLGYMVRNFQPDVLIDLATLTGSVIGTLGYHAAGLFSNNDELTSQLLKSASETGERLWPLPLWDVYKEDIQSDVADLKNFSGKPMAGAISAAKFLEIFTEEHPAWAHLDIAGMAFTDTEFGTQKNATGFGIRLLIDFLRNM
ncbi:leucyl aminopeptidase family protein [Larkinella rosea]|uniref:Probable cytosol aminopeptidase n=1 Tax=Larkinella rosea TaxID=2025312 RepID=A0A3P1BRQ2_9BACT|nr:leucyl aminopeptidase family protein [Larkinella rosea]RRB03728.1 leucyl aminopeptidase family protein [Larkinella rosea]